MPTAIAIEGDTQAETSTAKLSADSNQTGSWSLINFTVVTGTKVSAGNKKVELSATASWEYKGGSTGSPPAPVVTLAPVIDNASLQAGSTKLTDADQGILVDGDEATGSIDSGNKITVSASQNILKTD